jgi:uncharacterized protein YihD (DUF1040 family)
MKLKIIKMTPKEKAKQFYKFFVTSFDTQFAIMTFWTFEEEKRDYWEEVMLYHLTMDGDSSDLETFLDDRKEYIEDLQP